MSPSPCPRHQSIAFRGDRRSWNKIEKQAVNRERDQYQDMKDYLTIDPETDQRMFWQRDAKHSQVREVTDFSHCYGSPTWNRVDPK
jgi:hypothetical protein